MTPPLTLSHAGVKSWMDQGLGGSVSCMGPAVRQTWAAILDLLLTAS